MMKTSMLLAVLLLPTQNTTAEKLPVRPKPVRTDRKGPLAGLPGAPGAHLDKIRGLKDGEWVSLGTPAPDPKWGGARGRSWSAQMTYAPDLQGAFIIGMGVHNFITPDGRLQDDIFFYDLNGHRWIAVYGGTNTTTFLDRAKSAELKIGDDGQLADKEGHPVPVSMIPHHSYHAHTYDTDQKKYVVAWNGNGVGHVGCEPGSRPEWEKAYREALGMLGGKSSGRPEKLIGTPLFFNTIAGKFERFALSGQPLTGAADGGVHGSICYLPTRKAFFHYHGGVTQLYDAVSHQCQSAGAQGKGQPGSSDVGLCYDSKRDRVYMGRGNYAPPPRPDEGNVYIYDVKANAWSNPPNKPNAGSFPPCNAGNTHYDVANDRVVAISHPAGSREPGTVSVYNPETGAWEAGAAIPPAVSAGGECWHSFYSPEVNAHFLYVAGDSTDRGTMWAFRYKNHKK